MRLLLYVIKNKMALKLNNLKGEKVTDPYHSKERLEYLLQKGFETFSLKDKPIVMQYINDMRSGRNVNGSKGQRGNIHLCTLFSRLIRFSEIIKQVYNKSMIELTADELHTTFNDMKEGKIKKNFGHGAYKSVHDYIKIFKAFWHWYQKVQRQKGIDIPDTTIDLSGTAERKPEFIYFTFESLKKLMMRAKYDMGVFFLYKFDAGDRVTESLNIKKKDIIDLGNGEPLKVCIREETSKTFGRTIKLMLSNDTLKEYIKTKDFAPNDYIFPFKPETVNKYLRRLGDSVFGKNLKELRENRGSKQHITLYDFRHSSVCYWLVRYKNENVIKYRFGWKKSDMIYYYSEFLGMQDTITEDDMLIDRTKTELERQLDQERKERQMMHDRMIEMESRMKKVYGFMEQTGKVEEILAKARL